MIFFFLSVIVHVWCIVYCSTLSGFNLYHTHHQLNRFDHDCLYYFSPAADTLYQLIRFCIRSHFVEEVFDDMDNDNQFTFAELRQKNITSDHLYDWSASIDLIEYYQSYLETNISINNSVFYNCTYPWFGNRCEYSFNDSKLHFGDQVKYLFERKSQFGSNYEIIPPCYVHLQCNRVHYHDQTPDACLDWREVCDGKVDCIDGGQDEEPCWQLELNECEEKTEFRCHDGLCIPQAFLRDDQFSPDCLDRSDEPLTIVQRTDIDPYLFRCFRDPTFRCENRRCHPTSFRKHMVECGDGSCLSMVYECANRRTVNLLNRFWLGTNVSDDCSLSIACLTELATPELLDDCYRLKSIYVENITRYCPTLIVLSPIFFGHVRFIYTNNQTEKINSSTPGSFAMPDYVCYDGKLCESNLFSAQWSPSIDLLGNNSTCRLLGQFEFDDDGIVEAHGDIINRFYKFFRRCLNYNQPSTILNHSNLYQCVNSSKIISQHRLLDGIEDCLHGDDESYERSCSLKNFNYRFQCDSGNKTKCVARSIVLDDYYDCFDESDEKTKLKNELETIISFQTLCNGYTEFLPIMIDGRNETDETECDFFPCNNIYTRCDRFWNCPNGIDEVNCEWPPICPPSHHMCLSPIFGNITCLHIKHINDGIVDCLGASDERKFCREVMKNVPSVRYRCWNSDKCIGANFACVNPPLCPINNNNTMNFCSSINSINLGYYGCRSNPTHVEQLICTINDKRGPNTVHFSIISSTYSLNKIEAPAQTSIVLTNNEIIDDSDLEDFKESWFCNRGLIVRRRLMSDKNDTENICLCPPAYYGHLCQYENQRVSLTMQVRSSFDFRTQFSIVITLRDDQHNFIESHDQLNYLYERDCRKKYNIDLLYSTRPKNTSTNHSVHIDIFNRETFKHRASWLFPIKFPFLPVYNLVIQIQIPPERIITQQCKTFDCGNHGHCSQYTNAKGLFCICNKGWSGKYCHIPYTNYCSPDSFAFASNICICALHKFGSRCYLKHRTCTCKNNGICVSNDERISDEKSQWCICPKGFSGFQCELVDVSIDFSFAAEVTIPQSMLVHFINVSGKNAPHNHWTVPVRISNDEDIVSISRSIPFHIVFIEILQVKTYYLSVFQKEFIPSVNITSTIKNSDRCLSINELFNESFVKWHLLRRMKYYNIPCQKRSDLTCFYDEYHMCICSSDLRQANCMTFNHSMSYECEEENPCTNEGKCFRDRPICPSTFVCQCDECSYGSQCQISTRNFGLSLDIIFAYHIKPYRSFSQQGLIVHVTTGIILIMLIFGIVSNSLSIVTFHTKNACEVGCGYYLLASSYISLITIIIFALKFIFLLVSQMALITNHTYLTFNCITFELLLKVFLSTSDWLNAFVAIERVFSVIQKVKFNKIQSKRVAKWMIVCICIVTTTTHIHDPISRVMVDDVIDQRSWCYAKFSPAVELYNSIILAIHFGCPFLLNITSALIITIMTARQKFITLKQKSYRNQLRKQLFELKHLLISPIILIILASPRLIISFLSGCIKTTRENPWLYLSGYLISFLPPMLIMVVFILPSEVYKNELKNILKRLQNYMRRN